MSDLRPTGSSSQKAEQWRARQAAADRAARHAAWAFSIAIVACLGLVVTYLAGGQTQVEGLLLFVAFFAIGIGLAVWVKRIVGPQEVVEDRYPMRSADEDRDRFEEAVEETLDQVGLGDRRRFLLRLLTGAGASLGLALLIPLRSLGPGPENELFFTAWTPGARLVDPEGRAIRAEDVVSDQVVTVFPEGHVGSADSQAVLVGTREGLLQRDQLVTETVDGMVVYSKICTHAGCPVGLYRARAGELLCPCHQSTFDVNRGAVPVSGPAGRALPQLPIGVNDQGFLVALGDFSAPVGPSFWNMTRTPRTPEA
jgi:ubiquinol-cytochrome c reductase iron-sulfur subunit